MILKFILSNFSRRKVRTILMILSLSVSTGLIVAMSSTVATVRQSSVDLIASGAGRFDLSVSKVDTSSDPYIAYDEVSPEILAADDRIKAVYPRIESSVEMEANGNIGDGRLIALDPDSDDIGFIHVVDGAYELGSRHAAVLEDTAYTFDLGVGDTIDVSYSFPLPREEGRPNTVGASQKRTSERFTISAIVRQDGVTSGGVREGLIIHLADAQEWLDIPGRVGSVAATVEPSLYETNNAETAALRVRDVVLAVQSRLGDEYSYSLDKARAINGAAEAFLAIQALINTYGFVALAVVGLLVYTLVMTNVHEQRRDMAILRILGAQRNFLFTLVIAEVLVIGAIGVTLGVALGQLITKYIVVPIIQQQMAMEGVSSPLTPQLTLAAIIPVIISAFVVLIISSIRPAQEASRTKVAHAINPGVADNIQIEDLDRLRERRPDFKMFLGGLALMSIFALIAGFAVIETFGGPALQVVFILLALGLLVLGLGLMFFIVTVPLERLVLFLMGLIVPRLTYFASRNVGRGQMRNTLISLLVLFSGVLPSFLATQMALERANFEATVRQDMGAPASIQVVGYWESPENPDQFRLKPNFRTNELMTVAGIDQSVGLTYGYQTAVSDQVGFNTAPLNVIGVDGYLNDVAYADLVEISAGGKAALDDFLEDPEAIVISEGLAQHLAVSLGDRIKVQGQGTDHVLNAKIIAIARKLPSMGGFGRSRISAQSNSDALISIDGFRQLITELNQPLPPNDEPIIDRVMMTLAPGASAQEAADQMGKSFGRNYRLWIRFLEVELETNQRDQAMIQVFLLVLTMISFTTAVFGVFAVIYVNVYARRIEIGMLKALGMKRRELTWMLNLESITMTLGAALAGIVAGAAMSYIIFFGERFLTQRPKNFAMDTTVIPFIVIMVVLASVLGATLSARRIVKKKAVEILRM
jgi:ABC-type lipoprotein release transport system permease subunit